MERLDVDRLMRDIRAEVGSRLDTPGLAEDTPAPASTATRASAVLPRLGAFAEDLPKRAHYRADDFLAFHDEDFVRQAYRRILRREPDREGASRYLAKIRTGELSRIEVLGRIRFSPEGRAAGVPVAGLAFPFALRTFRRTPIAGRLVGIVQYLWRLPDLARRHETLESAMFANRTALREQVNAILDEVERRLATFASAAEVDGLGNDVRGIVAHAARLASRLGDVEHDKVSHGELDGLRVDMHARAARANAAVEAVRSDLRAHAERANAALEAVRSDARTSVERTDARFSSVEENVASAFARLDAGERERADAAQRVAALLDDLVRTRRAVDALRDGNQALAQRIARLPSLEELGAARVQAEAGQPRGSAIAPPKEAAATVNDEGFYVAFEDRYRGTREDIRQRVAIYLPIVRAAGAGAADAPLLDIGCGRGEWLELLREEQLQARGVDTNRVAVAGCQARGLDVVAADALEYLRALPAASLGAISAIHVIEHLPFARLVDLFDEAHRVLRQGGAAIFETPNPENLVVGACNFYYDPTHERPLPPEPFRFILESRGFERVEIMRLHSDTRAVDLSFLPADLASVLGQRLFGPQDYALVGFRR